MSWLGRSLVFGLVWVCGCASSGVSGHPEYGKLQKEIAKVIDGVRTSTGPALLTNLNRLVAYDIFAVEQVSKLARDQNPRLRCNALWVLSHVDDPDYPEIQRKIDGLLWAALKDSDRLVRFEAAAGLLERNHWEAIPILLEGMSDTDPAVRLTCHEALQTVTSKDFGYRADLQATERHAAVARWRAWYEEWRRENG